MISMNRKSPEYVQPAESIEQADLLANFKAGLTEVPEHLREGLLRYFQHGIRPGDFLTRVLHNDLTAVLYAGPETAPHIQSIVAFVMNHMPAVAWASRDAVSAWSLRGGLDNHPAMEKPKCP